MGEVTQLGGGEDRPGGAVLLCELCGYEIAGLGDHAKCPECGTSVAESMPARRTGTAWQRRPGAGVYISTVRDSVWRQSKMLRTAAVAPRRDFGFYMLNAFVSSAVPLSVIALLPPLIPQDGPSQVRFLAIIFRLAVAVGVGWLAIAFAALVVFYLAWGVVVFTTRRVSMNVGYLAASVASSWLVFGSLMCAIALPLVFVSPGFAIVVFVAGFLLGWGGYAWNCFRGLVRMRYANLPVRGAEGGVLTEPPAAGVDGISHGDVA